MDFELSDDQQALREGARALLDGHASPDRVRVVVDAGGGLDTELWKAMGAQGWPAIAVPEALGGVGLGWVEVAVLLEEVGTHVAPAPILQQVVALDALCAAAEGGVTTVAGRPLADWIGSLAAGDEVATVAASPVTAEQAGEGVTLTGRTEPAVYAPAAQLAVVVAELPDSTRALVATALDDVSRPAPEPAMDRTRQVGWLRFDGTPATVLGGDDAVEAFLDAGAVATSAELLGVASRALDLAVAYAKDRVQFGRPIGSFQAVKHRCADMLVDVEGMRSTAYWAAWCLAAGDGERSVAASTAKTWCADAGGRVTASCLQVHGGIGFTWESDVHLLLKRAHLDRLSFGDAPAHRTRLARLLRARVDAGASVI